MEAMEPSFRKNILNSPRILEGPWILIKKKYRAFFGFYQRTCLSHQQSLKPPLPSKWYCFPFHLNPLNLPDAPACGLGRVLGARQALGRRKALGRRAADLGPSPGPQCRPVLQDLLEGGAPRSYLSSKGLLVQPLS